MFFFMLHAVFFYIRTSICFLAEAEPELIAVIFANLSLKCPVLTMFLRLIV